MGYYILYPRKKGDKVKIVTKRPNPKTVTKKYGFSEGSFETLEQVKRRLNQMNIPSERRPKNVR